MSNQSLRDKITRAEVKSIFLFKQKEWKDAGGNHPITVVIYNPDSAKFKEFAESFLDMDADEYKQLIEEGVASGEIKEPIKVTYDVQMRVKVSQNIYAIGYLNKGLYFNTPFGLKFLKVTN